VTAASALAISCSVSVPLVPLQPIYGRCDPADPAYGESRQADPRVCHRPRVALNFGRHHAGSDNPTFKVTDRVR